jgi:hypothetical protein
MTLHVSDARTCVDDQVQEIASVIERSLARIHLIRTGGSEKIVDDRVTLIVYDRAEVTMIDDGCRLKNHVDAWAESEERRIGVFETGHAAEVPHPHLVRAARAELQRWEERPFERAWRLNPAAVADLVYALVPVPVPSELVQRE